MSYGDGSGFESEELVKELLQASGWGVKELRKAADEGNAPMLEATEIDDLRLVDFQAHHPNHPPRYVEVKSFKGPIEYGVENSLRHGYEKRKHDDYVNFQKMENHPVYLFVHERKPGVVIRQKIKHLSAVGFLRDEQKLRRYYNREHEMLFFERSQFEKVTNNVGQYASGYGQDGLIKDDIKLSPFGLDESGDQSKLGGFSDD